MTTGTESIDHSEKDTNGVMVIRKNNEDMIVSPKLKVKVN